MDSVVPRRMPRRASWQLITSQRNSITSSINQYDIAADTRVAHTFSHGPYACKKSRSKVCWYKNRLDTVGRSGRTGPIALPSPPARSVISDIFFTRLIPVSDCFSVVLDKFQRRFLDETWRHHKGNHWFGRYVRLVYSYDLKCFRSNAQCTFH